MATPLNAEIIKSTRGKDKLVLLGFIYTLNRSTTGLKHWNCEKRSECKARITTNSDLSIVKPQNSSEIFDTHPHAPDMLRIEMLKGYTKMKERADQNSEENTRSIFAYGVETMTDSSIAKMPRIESIKRTIRLHKSGPEKLVNAASASDIEILERHKTTLKGEPFLLFDSGIGDASRIIIFSTPKMFSILRESQSWLADGTFKVVPQQFYQLYTIHAEKDGYIFPCVYIGLNEDSNPPI